MSVKTKYYPFTEFERKRDRVDVSGRFTATFLTFFGKHSYEPFDTVEEETQANNGIPVREGVRLVENRYRLGILDYLTLGIYPLCVQGWTLYTDKEPNPLHFIGLIPLAAATAVLFAAKAIIAVAFALVITLAVTFGRMLAFPLTHPLEETQEAWNSLRAS